MHKGPSKLSATSTEPSSVQPAEVVAAPADVAIDRTDPAPLLESMYRTLSGPISTADRLHGALRTMIRQRHVDSTHSKRTLPKAGSRNVSPNQRHRDEKRRVFDAYLAQAMLGSDFDLPDKQYECEQTLRLLMQSLADLPEQQRLAIELMSVDGLSAAETAACLGITEQTARRLTRKALFRLQSDMDAAGKDQ